MGDQGVKFTGIRQIVRLKAMLREWHLVTISKKEGQLPTVREKNNRLEVPSILSDSSEDEGYESPDPDIPKGHFSVNVGVENRRFVIPACYLRLPVFKRLLKKAEEEFGFVHKGALSLPCEVETFKYILQCLERHKQALIREYDESD